MKEEGTKEKEGKPEQMCVQKRTDSVPHEEQCSKLNKLEEYPVTMHHMVEACCVRFRGR
jgi:hypothetical protein